MKAVLAAAAAAILVQAVPARAALVPWRDASDIVATTPSTDDGALAATVNPAQWGLLERPELSGFWTSDTGADGRPRPWGFSAGSG
ncbi:MAG: hypothetical protein ACM3PF_06450, partial [Bacteroidota bacterium]